MAKKPLTGPMIMAHLEAARTAYLQGCPEVREVLTQLFSGVVLEEAPEPGDAVFDTTNGHYGRVLGESASRAINALYGFGTFVIVEDHNGETSSHKSWGEAYRKGWRTVD